MYPDKPDQEPTTAAPSLPGQYPVPGEPRNIAADHAAKLAVNRQLPLHLGQQDELTLTLNDRLEALFQKIQPVWQSPNPTPSDPEGERPEYVQHAETVARNNDRIRRAITAVNLMIEGLEV